MSLFRSRLKLLVNKAYWLSLLCSPLAENKTYLLVCVYFCYYVAQKQGCSQVITGLFPSFDYSSIHAGFLLELVPMLLFPRGKNQVKSGFGQQNGDCDIPHIFPLLNGLLENYARLITFNIIYDTFIFFFGPVL